MGISDKIQSIRDMVADPRDFIRPPIEKLDQFKTDLFNAENEHALSYLKIDRGLSEETIKHFNLGYEKSRNAIAIPNFKNGELINIMYRIISPEGKQQKYIQEKDGEVWIFNEKGIDLGLPRQTVLVVEGQFDCMSVWQAGIKNVVSVGSGKESYGMWMELLDPIAEIYIAYDNDKPGRESSYKFAERLGIEKCKEIAYPEDIKDANDYFKQYIKKDFLKLVDQARPFYTRKYNDLLDVISILRDDQQEKLEIDIIPDVKLTPDHLLSMAGSTNAGKCLAKGTEVMMSDGSIKKVEDIIVGDFLMGEDSKPKEVLTLGHGFEEMFRIFNKHEYYDVNKSHILSLKKFNKHYYEKTVEEYLQIPEKTRSTYRGWKTGINFEKKPVKLDPYYLGLWLGDGTSNDTSITSADDDVVNWITQYADSLNIEITKIYHKNNKSSSYRLTNHIKDSGNNYIRNCLKEYGVFNNKNIPFEYKTNDNINRLRLLAGIIDSDGHLSKSDRGECYEIIQKNKILVDDIVFLARSLGFRVVINKCNKSIKSIGFTGEYYRIHIVGDLFRIPVLLTRKKSYFSPKKNFMTYNISVEALGIGEYFGFTLSGNGLYILGDFTVTHNTMYALNITKRLVEKGIPTLVLPYERGVQVVGSRFLQILLEKTESELKHAGNDEWEKMIRKVVNTPAYFSLPNKDEFSDVIIKAKRILGIKAVVIDHLDYMIRGQGNEESAIRSTMHELKSLAIEHQIMMFVVTHTRRTQQPGGKNGKPTMHDMRGSESIAQDSETVVMLHKESDTSMEVDVQKNKGKMSNILFNVDYETGLMGKQSDIARSLDDF